MIDPKILEILACPDCKTRVFLDRELFLQCENPECRRRYRIEDDIPIMLIDESEILSEADFGEAMTRRK